MQEISFDNKIYRISYEPMSDNLKEKLSKEEFIVYVQLLEEIQKKPRSNYDKIKEFCSAHLEVAEVVNLLTYAHLQNKKIHAAEKLIEQTYENYPDYLFARINYADQCLRKGKLGKIASIFSSFDLQELYPEKKVFHTSEFRGYFIFMSYYHLALRQKEKAKGYYEIAKTVEPHYPGLFHLERKIFKKSFFKKLFKIA